MTSADLEEHYRKKLAFSYDESGRLLHLSAKKPIRMLALQALAENFETGVDYTEKQVNAILGGKACLSRCRNGTP